MATKCVAHTPAPKTKAAAAVQLRRWRPALMRKSAQERRYRDEAQVVVVGNASQ
jgi:hypothetical protein